VADDSILVRSTDLVSEVEMITRIVHEAVGTVSLAGSGNPELNNLFGRIQGILQGVAVFALTVAIIIIGFKIMFAIRNGDNVRVAIQNMGVVAIAALIVGGASGIASLLSELGKQIGG
jgi:hypothetical protein